MNRIDIDFLYQGLHEFPNKLNEKLNEALKMVDKDNYDYILLNYGLCGNGTLDITHPDLPIIIHNAQDCIPILVGNRKKYKKYVDSNPGIFWFSCGWIEGFPLPGSPDYAERYSEFYKIKINEKQRDSIERMLFENYKKLKYISWKEMGEDINRCGSKYTMECVNSINSRLSLNMSFGKVEGSSDTLQKFVDGDWNNDEFLLINPGQKLKFDITKGRLYVE